MPSQTKSRSRKRLKGNPSDPNSPPDSAELLAESEDDVTISFGESAYSPPPKRAFYDTAAYTDFVRLLYDKFGDQKKGVGSGSFGSVSEFFPASIPDSFVVKEFKNTDRNAYNMHVLRTLKESTESQKDTLSQYIVWSRLFFEEDEFGDEHERVIMEFLEPWNRVLLGAHEHMRNEKGVEVFEAFQKWLRNCIDALENVNIYAPDLKAANMGCRENKETDQFEFRLIDTDGLCSGDSLSYVSSHVNFNRGLAPINFKGHSIQQPFQWQTKWQSFLRATHAYLFAIVVLQARVFLKRDKDPNECLFEIVNAQLHFAKTVAEVFNTDTSNGLILTLSFPGTFEPLFKDQKKRDFLFQQRLAQYSKDGPFIFEVTQTGTLLKLKQ